MWLERANRFVAWLLATLSLLVLAAGAYLGFFAWLNSGFKAGLELFGVAAGVCFGFMISAQAFRLVARAPGAGSPNRWLMQVLLPLAAWSLFIVTFSVADYRIAK